jgi:hypothetical protein
MPTTARQNAIATKSRTVDIDMEFEIVMELRNHFKSG